MYTTLSYSSMSHAFSLLNPLIPVPVVDGLHFLHMVKVLKQHLVPQVGLRTCTDNNE